MERESIFELCYSHLDVSFEEISSLETVLKEWNAEGIWDFESRPAIPYTDRLEWTIKCKDVPVRASVLAANAIHNMRVPLDQMLAIYFRSVVNTSGGRPRNLAFPARADKEAFFKAIANLKPLKLPVEAVDFLKSTEAFISGQGEEISLLHALDIESKHHGLLKVEIGFSKLQFEQARGTQGILFRIGQLEGQHMFNKRPGVLGKQDLVQPNDGARPIYREVSGRRYLEFSISDPSRPVLVTSHDFTVNESIVLRPEIEVLLRHEKLKGKKVICFLKSAHQRVKGTLASFIEKTNK
jgi:hypothetical protein